MSNMSSSAPAARTAAVAASSSSNSTAAGNSSCAHRGTFAPTAADQSYIPTCFVRYAARIGAGEMIAFFDIF
jgi:hypothetical protein